MGLFIHVEYWIHSHETDTDVRIYIEEFILVDVVTLLYKLKMIYIGKYTGIYTSATMEKKG